MIIIDDDFLDKEAQEKLLDMVSGEGSPIQWFFNAHTNVADPNGVYAISTPNTVDSFQMVSVVDLGHPMYHLVLPMLRKLASKHGIEINNIMRIKLNLIAPDCNAEGHHMPHVDTADDHKVFLYYINDSDGDTIFFNERHNGNPVNELTEDRRVSPKMGRGVIFDGSIYHASSSPSDSSFRCIINVDFN